MVTHLQQQERSEILIGMMHRLENPGKLPLHLIEVQAGSDLGQDDIVRLEDIYQRVWFFTCSALLKPASTGL